jgi:2-C-methyl-D-erythritol 4-phosphate cytidylyltransferase
MIVAAIVVAAGSGERLGAAVPKAFVELGAQPLLVRAVAPFATHPAVRDVVVVAPPALVESARELTPNASVVPGGPTRQQSVARGLAAVATDVEAVLVHDAARPFVPAEVVSRVIEALAGGAEAVIPVLPVVDTIKRVENGHVVETPDRDTLRVVQTPQGFRRDVLDKAHAQQLSHAPDDASLAESLGVTVQVVAGADAAFKITTPADLARAEAACREPR